MRFGRFTACVFSLSFALGSYGWAILGCAGGSKLADPSSTPQKGVIYYHPDHLGSAHLITDSQGNVLREEVWYPFGLDKVVEETDADEADYVYTGKEYDAETGLIYFGARYYAPEIGRWITPDPLFLEEKPDMVHEHPFSSNIYAYVRNNPVMYVDLEGKVENYIWHENRRNFEWQPHESTQPATNDKWIEICTSGCGYVNMAANSPEEAVLQKALGYSIGALAGVSAISGYYAVGPYVAAELVSSGVSDILFVKQITHGIIGGLIAGSTDQRTGLMPSITSKKEFYNWVISLTTEEITKIIKYDGYETNINKNDQNQRGQ